MSWEHRAQASFEIAMGVLAHKRTAPGDK